MREVTLQVVSMALRIKEILHESLKTGNWSEAPKGYSLVRDEVTYIGQVVLRETRIVVPGKLRKSVLELVHEGPQGIVETKER